MCEGGREATGAGVKGREERGTGRGVFIQLFSGLFHLPCKLYFCLMSSFQRGGVPGSGAWSVIRSTSDFGCADYREESRSIRGAALSTSHGVKFYDRRPRTIKPRQALFTVNLSPLTIIFYSLSFGLDSGDPLL